MNAISFKLRLWLSLLCCLTLSFAIPTLTLAATDGSRTFTFVNQCPFPVWFGMAGGATGTAQQGVACTIDNSGGDGTGCPAGSACRQTGNITQCFWKNPAPQDGNYQLTANGGTNHITIPFYPKGNGGVWSGIVAGRTGCTDKSCETASCNADGADARGACSPSHGFGQPATQAEFTLGSKSQDFYDVEVINGINIPVEMAPSATSLTKLAKAPRGDNPYWCGNPGGTKAMTSAGACSWQFTPPSSEYVWVQAQNNATACTQDSDCTTNDQRCGFTYTPGKAQPFQKMCGKFLGYWTADQICGINPQQGEPFNCAQTIPVPDSKTHWNMTNLYQCSAGMPSCYQPNADGYCCGCVNWDKVGVNVPASTQQCTNLPKNPNETWNSNVLPKLQWIKQACPTAYTYPYDDMSSTFLCKSNDAINSVDYTVTFCPGGQTGKSTQAVTQ